MSQSRSSLDRDSQGKGQACSGGSKAEGSGHPAHGRPSVFISLGYKNKVPQVGWLITKVSHNTLVKQYTVFGDKSSQGVGHALSETCGGILLRLFQASGGPVALLGVPWLVNALTTILHLHIVFFLSVFTWMLLIWAPVTSDEGPTALQQDLILTNSICNDPLSK